MDITIHPSRLHGPVEAPPSKSVTQRALAAAFIRRGTTILRNTGVSADELALIRVLETTGCTIARSGRTITVDSSRAHPATAVSFGESGLAARMMMPLLALQEGDINFSGTGSLPGRPMNFLTDALEQLGVQVLDAATTLPITLRGPLIPTNLTVDGSASSQAVTGLIVAFVAAGADGITLTVANPVSTPYLALTLQVLEAMKLPAPTADAGFTTFHFQSKPIKPSVVDYSVEGDWSGAAFLMAAGAIAGHARISGLDVFTTQGDKAVLHALMDASARLSITAERIEVNAAPMKAFHYNAVDTPDLFPPLAALAAYTTSGTSVIEGAHRLAGKESNRTLTLQEELCKMGIRITLQDDLMLIEGGHPVTGAVVDSRGDHRIAMACAVAALGAAGPTTIRHAGAVQKSYPHFFQDLQSLGASITGL